MTFRSPEEDRASLIIHGPIAAALAAPKASLRVFLRVGSVTICFFEHSFEVKIFFYVSIFLQEQFYKRLYA